MRVEDRAGTAAGHRPWRVRNRRLVWGSPWYRIVEDQVELPDGSTFEYYLSERPNIAIVLAVTGDDRVVLVRQYRHGAGEVTLELPAGTFTDEEPAEAAARELREETGYRCAGLTPAGIFFDDASRNTNATHVFLGHDATLVGTPELDDVEVASGLHTLLVPLGELPGLLASGEIRAQISVAAAYQAMRLLGPVTDRSG